MSIVDAKWIQRFADLAALVSGWSKDPSTKVGAVIVDHSCRVLSLGYNGFPRGVSDDAVRYEQKNVKYAMIVHSEANAILNAGHSVRECVMITTKSPCSECAKLIIQSGITDVYSPEPTPGRWADDSMIARQMFQEAGVEQKWITINQPLPLPQSQHDAGALVYMKEAIETLRSQRDKFGDKTAKYDELTIVARNMRDAFEWLYPHYWSDPEHIPFSERVGHSE